MADDDPWLLKEDGILNVGTKCRQILYHPNLNVLLITTARAHIHVFDVNGGSMLEQCVVSDKADTKLQGVYLGEGVDKILYTDGKGIGVRCDYNGVLLLDTILQMPVFRSEDTIKLEMLLSEAILLHHCLRSVELPGVDHVEEVSQELCVNIAIAKTRRRKGIKAQKWNTICLELSHGALKLVCSNLVMDLKRQNKHIPALPIASAISERLNGLLPGLVMENGNADKVLMYSEAARRDTFSKWPHMNYKWALPDQMAQAGFYHQPNSTGEDRAMCFTCSVCLVCWEPTDEPWSEHERHSPACPFVKGEYTQNVPLSVTLATAPAQAAGESVDVISTTNVAGLVSTSSNTGFVSVWNVTNQLKKEVSFYISPCEGETNNKDTLRFIASKTSSTSSRRSYLPSLVTETDPLVDAYKSSSGLHSTSSRLQLTALALVDGPKNQSDNKNANSMSSVISQESDTVVVTSIRPCLICGVSVSSNSVVSTSSNSQQQQRRTQDNVWVAWDLASSSSLVRACSLRFSP